MLEYLVCLLYDHTNQASHLRCPNLILSPSPYPHLSPSPYLTLNLSPYPHPQPQSSPDEALLLQCWREGVEGRGRRRPSFTPSPRSHPPSSHTAPLLPSLLPHSSPTPPLLPLFPLPPSPWEVPIPLLPLSFPSLPSIICNIISALMIVVFTVVWDIWYTPDVLLHF